jgi:hypothetical protein
MKLCTKCGVVKPRSEFHKCKAKKGGLHHSCKSCVSRYNAEYYSKNVNKLAEYKKKYNEENVEYIKEMNKNWRLENKEYIKKKGSVYRQNNQEKLLERNRKYRIENRDKVNKYDREYRMRRNAIDINYKLRNTLRSRLNIAIRNNQKVGSAVYDLGCTVEHLKTHLEDLFLPGMSWKNYGKEGWHIDHIIPLCHFCLADEEQFKEACHYTNLQPLWAKDNLAKGNRL